MSTKTHTPLPWSVGEDNEVLGPYGVNIVVTDSGFYPPTPEDAAFIVRACNAHDELVAALRVVVALDSFLMFGDSLDKARAALAKLEEP